LGSSAPPPTITTPATQPTSPTLGVDYNASELGGLGFALSLTSGFKGGHGGSGNYGIGGIGGIAASGLVATGNAAGGGGGSRGPSSVAQSGGNGALGIWIIEEYS